MPKTNPVKEAFVFFGLALGLSYFVFWGPLALFHIPTISFVHNTMGPAWAIVLFIIGGFVPSLVAVFLTWKQEGKVGLRHLGQRIVQFNIGWRWYLAAAIVIILATVGQLVIIRTNSKSIYDLAPCCHARMLLSGLQVYRGSGFPPKACGNDNVVNKSGIRSSAVSWSKRGCRSIVVAPHW